MPDTFSTSLALAGLFHGIEFLENKKLAVNLILYLFLAGIGILSKIHTGYILVFLIVSLLNKKVLLKNEIVLCLTSIIFLASVTFWYFYWVPYLFEKYSFRHFFMGVSVSKGAKEIYDNLAETLKRFHRSAMMITGFIAFMGGLIISIYKKNKRIIFVFIIGFVAFIPALLKTGHKFAVHNYYIIPFVPVMALIAGYAVNQIKVHWLYLTIIITICMENVLNTWTKFSPRKERWTLMELENVMDKVSNREDLITINAGDDPTALYLAHRKGWRTNNNDLQKPEYKEKLKRWDANMP
ncbi:MAG: hypothetical protein JW894_06790 [Bacteroidales bacterium]|nr:hypothetical protein [Bacteroidales bacterium]